MTGVSRAVNPYAVNRKPSSSKPPPTSTAGTGTGTGTGSSSSSSSSKNHEAKPKPKPVSAERSLDNTKTKPTNNAPQSASVGKKNNSSNNSSNNNNHNNHNTQQPRSWHTMFEGSNGDSNTVKAKVNVVSAAKATAKTKQAKAKAPPSLLSQQPQQSQSQSHAAALNAKLRKDIGNLKRAKLLHQQRLEEEKRKKVLAKQQRKQKVAAEFIMKQNEKLRDERAAEELLQQQKAQVEAQAQAQAATQAELLLEQQQQLRDEEQVENKEPKAAATGSRVVSRTSTSTSTGIPMGGVDHVQQLKLKVPSPVHGNGGPPLSSPAALLPYDPVHHYQAQAQTQTQAQRVTSADIFPFQHQHQWQVPSPSVYPTTAPPPPPLLSSSSYGSNNAVHFQQQQQHSSSSSHSPPMSFSSAVGAGVGAGSWNHQNPMFPGYSMTSQQQQQHQQQQQPLMAPPLLAFAGSQQHVTPSPVVLSSQQQQQQFANRDYYAATPTPVSTTTMTTMPTAQTSTNPPASASTSCDSAHHSAAKRMRIWMQQPVKDSSITAGIGGGGGGVVTTDTDPHWTPNHNRPPSVGHPHHTNTDQATNHRSQSTTSRVLPNNDVNAAGGTNVVDHHNRPCSPNVPAAPKMETNVATPQNSDQSSLLHTTTTSMDTNTNTSATSTTSNMPMLTSTPSLLVAAAEEERTNTKNAELQQLSDHKFVPTPPASTLSFPDQEQGRQASFVPQPMQYGTPSPLTGQQQQQPYPNPNPMLDHPVMNYGGYQPYASSPHPNRMTHQSHQSWGVQQMPMQHQQQQPWTMQLQQRQPQSWAMQQQQQQQFYQPTMYQQPPIPYRMPPDIISGRSTTKQPPRSRPRPVVDGPKRGAERLAKVLESPSPFLSTHELLPFTITMVKKPGESFGATIRNEIESALVEPEWLDKMASGTVETLKPNSPVREPVPKVEIKVNDPAEQVKVNDSVVETKAEAVVFNGKTEPSVTTAVPLQSGDKLDDAPSSGGIASAAGDAKRADTQKAEIVKPRKARRTRVFFAAMTVMNPTIQNQRLASPDPSKRLMQGDILLVINGNKTAGLTFHDACALFASCNQVADDGMVYCTVTIARRKPKSLKMAVLPAPSKLLVALPTTGPAAREFDLSPLKPAESSVFANSLLKAVCDSKRQLGRPVSDALLQSVTSLDPALSSRGFSTLKVTWSSISQGLEYRMSEKALNFWKSQWKNEPSEVKSLGMEYLTDAQRSSMRAAPRPPKGCRCGKIDHDYCHDHRCPLYSDIRAGDPVSAESTESGPKRTLSKLPRDLNTVETAFKDRFVRLQAEKEAQEAEARFVDRMEELQLKNHSKAVFAPSLTAMVLCTVHDLQGYFKDDVIEPVSPIVAVETSPVVVPKNENDSDDDSDDEDMPLAALGKRTLNDSVGAANKKQKTEMVVRRKFLAKLVQSISRKWGHVYREPSDVEYAWRWEVHHGQTCSETSSRWEASFKNPRKTGALTFENIHFVVEDGVVSKVEDPIPSQEHVDALQLLLHVLSPTRSGVCDELLALIHMGVLAVDERGIPALCHDWWSNVDVLLLDDMSESWGVAADPSGKYGITDAVRMPLNEEWTKAEDGWALGEEDIVYEDSEFDAWRAAFEDKQQAQSDNIEGVGRFGI